MTEPYGPSGSENQSANVLVNIEAFGSLLRFIGTGLGLICIVIGLTYSMKLFWAIYNGLSSPESFEPLITHWTKTLGAGKLDFTFQEATYSVGRLFAFLALGMGVILLVWIAFGFMKVGAQIVSLTSSDREAVKKILHHVYPMTGGKPIETSTPSSGSDSNRF